MIPVMSNPPLCRLKELQDGTYDLADVALMVDALYVRADNDLIAFERERDKERVNRGR
jgi:hypothetical protein